MHLHSKAEELVEEMEKVITESQNKMTKQSLENLLEHAEYLVTRLKEIGS
jgi:hypothetical protein